MGHERFDPAERGDTFFRLAVIGVALIIGTVKIPIDRYIADAKTVCVAAGEREHDELRSCVNREIYGSLYDDVPDFLLVSVDDVKFKEGVVAKAER